MILQLEKFESYKAHKTTTIRLLHKSHQRLSIYPLNTILQINPYILLRYFKLIKRYMTISKLIIRNFFFYKSTYEEQSILVQRFES